MKATRLLFLLALVPLSLFALGEWSRIDMGVSPIRHEFTVGTGKTITKTITFYNNSDTAYNIYLSAEDCVSDDKVGTPKCRPIIWSGTDSASLASWIKFEWASRFTVPAKSERKINFSVTPPKDALPGGHYGAIFLNNPEWTSDNGNTVKMVRRAWVLLLVNVPGKLIYDTEVWEIAIDVPLLSAPDQNDLPTNFRDPNTWEKWLKRITRELDPRVESPILVDTSDFSVIFTLPVTNNGNIHSLPVGRIELYDEDGSMLKKIGKETIRSPEWVFLGESIVDYLPINDEGGNVLPGSDRIFSVTWKGFAYETIEAGKSLIKFLSPGQYYTKQTEDNARYLLPWEKLKIFVASKKIHAKIYLEYRGENNLAVPFETEKDIYVKYNYIDKWLNWWAVLLILLVILIAWRLLRKRDDHIHELEDEVEELEDEVDEFEKAKRMAKAAIAKKKPTKVSKTEAPSKTKAPAKKKPATKKTPSTV